MASAAVASAPPPSLTRTVGNPIVAREVQSLLNKLCADSVAATAARLATLLQSGEAAPSALAAAVLRCGACFLPDAYSLLSAQLCNSVAWCAALCEALVVALSAAPSSQRRGSLAFAEQLAQLPEGRGAVMDALLRLCGSSNGTAGGEAELLIRLGPRLVASAPEDDGGMERGAACLLLDSLAANQRCSAGCASGNDPAMCAACACAAVAGAVADRSTCFFQKHLTHLCLQKMQLLRSPAGQPEWARLTSASLNSRIRE